MTLDEIEKKYDVILADPPWKYRNWSKRGEGKGAAAQYDTMAVDDIMRLPVGNIAAKDSVLFMWATFPLLPQAFAVMRAWGFDYKTGGAWAKKTKNGKDAFGTGYIFRSAAELFLVGTRGHVSPMNRKTRNIINAVAREHSRKPDEQYELIENLFPGTNRIELFARQHREGWDVFGNETDKFGG